MNTADRSIGHIDYAVRRRFAFMSVLPDINTINSDHGKRLFQIVESLFKDNTILSPDFHCDDVQPGHTYFMFDQKTQDEIKTLKMKFTYQVYPLLVEYYKDGILLPGNNGSLSLMLNGQEIKINAPERPERIMQVLDDFFNALSASESQEDD